MPWDAGAEASSSAALLNRENTLAGVRGDRLYQQEQGGLGEFANNPYSQAAALKQQRDNANKANLNSAGLQLYSGSTINHARGISAAYDRGRQRLEAEEAQAREQAKQREQDAQLSYQDSVAQATEGALDRAAAEPLAPEAPGRPRRRRRPRGR